MLPGVSLVAKMPGMDYNHAMTWEILGHEWATQMLREHVAKGRLRHAYLFTGPKGVGRRTLALRLAQAINCPQPALPGQPCGICPTCKRIQNMQHPDLAVVQAEQIGATLKVDQIRELQRSLSLAPYEARYRVALLLRFEEANPNAANALLKTLEEPSSQVVLILTAESPESLLPTIVSRCEVLRLSPLPLTAVSQGLQTGWNIPEEQARLLAHLSSGRPGYAVWLHQYPELLEKRQALLDDHQNLLNSNRAARFAYSEKLTKDKEATRLALQTWLSLWRDIMLRAARTSAPLTNLDRETEIENLASRIDLYSARCVISTIDKTLALLERNINTRLGVDVLLLDLPRL